MNAHQIADQIRLIENSVNNGSLHPADGNRMIRSMWDLAGTYRVDGELNEILNWGGRNEPAPQRSCSRARNTCEPVYVERGWEPTPPPQKRERSLQSLVNILNSYS